MTVPNRGPQTTSLVGDARERHVTAHIPHQFGTLPTDATGQSAPLTSDRWAHVVAHRPWLLSLARRRCRRREDAEDIVQEALLRAALFEGLDDERIEPFLITVVVRLSIDLHRRRVRDATLADGPLNGSPAIGPEEQACQRAELSWTCTKIRQLPQRWRSVLLQRLNGASVATVAADLGISEKAVESVSGRARHRLRLLRSASSAEH